MEIKKFVLSYYNNATEDFHIHNVKDTHMASKPHSHEYFQVYYVKKGELVHHIGDKTANMGKGDIFIVPPNTVHSANAKDDTIFYSFSFMPSFLCDTPLSPRIVSDFLQDLMKNEDSQIRPVVSLPSEEVMYMDSLMNQIQKEFESKPLGYYDGIRSMAVLLLLHLARGYYADLEKMSANFKENKETVKHCIEYIENNYFENITIPEISKYFAMSTSSFCRLFLSETGFTFNHYLNRLRIEKACEYIAKGYKATVIYSFVGYRDFSTFYRNFKKSTGLSPMEYKRKLTLS